MQTLGGIDARDRGRSAWAVSHGVSEFFIEAVFLLIVILIVWMRGKVVLAAFRG